MRSSKSRSRNKSNRQRSLGNVVNRVFDSSGPEGKVRGTPQQVIEKYLNLARDAQLSNDRVAEQSFLQHAEHYTRMLGEAQREMAERQQQGNQRQNGEDDRSNGYQNGHRDNGRDDNARDTARDDNARDISRDENTRDTARDDNTRDNHSAAMPEDQPSLEAETTPRDAVAEAPEAAEVAQPRRRFGKRDESSDSQANGRWASRSSAPAVEPGLPEPVGTAEASERLDLPEAPVAKRARRKPVKADQGDDASPAVEKPKPVRRKSKAADKSSADSADADSLNPTDQG